MFVLLIVYSIEAIAKRVILLTSYTASVWLAVNSSSSSNTVFIYYLRPSVPANHKNSIICVLLERTCLFSSGDDVLLKRPDHGWTDRVRRRRTRYSSPWSAMQKRSRERMKQCRGGAQHEKSRTLKRRRKRRLVDGDVMSPWSPVSTTIIPGLERYRDLRRYRKKVVPYI